MFSPGVKARNGQFGPTLFVEIPLPSHKTRDLFAPNDCCRLEALIGITHSVELRRSGEDELFRV
jgi:hypothetical protein